MNVARIAMGIALAGATCTPGLKAKPPESVTVRIPFAFTAANQVLPAGIYKLELLTNGQPGVDELEVITLRGVETRSYTALVARLGRSEAKAPVMSFSEVGETPALAEVRANGRRFALLPAETDYAIHRPAARFDIVSQRNLPPPSAATGKD